MMMDSLIVLLEGSRGFLSYLLTASFSAAFVVFILFFLLNLENVKKHFEIKRKTLSILITIFVLGLSLRALTPIYITTYGDELSHVSTGKSMFTTFRADCCSGYQDIGQRGCTMFNEPAGHSYVVGLFWFLFGMNMDAAYFTNLIISALIPVAVFFLVFLLFRDEKSGIYSAFLISILPLHMLLSRNIEPDPVSAFFILLTLISVILLAKNKDLKTGLFTAGILALTISMKQENILLIPIVALVLVFSNVDLKKRLTGRKALLVLIVFICLVLPHALHLSLELYPAMIYGESTATAVGGRIMNPGNIIGNSRVLIQSISGSFYPIIINALIFLGVFYAWRRNRKASLLLIGFFASYVFVYLSYSATIVEKYMVTALVPLFCFAGFGLSYLDTISSGRIGWLKGKSYGSFAISAVLLLTIMASSLPYFHSVFTEPKPLGVDHGFERGNIHYDEMETIRQIDNEIDNCYLISEEPIFFEASDLKVFRTESALTDQNLVGRMTEISDCVLYFEDLFCTDYYTFGERCGLEEESFETCEEFRRDIVSRCSKMKEAYELVPYRSFSTFGNFTFRLYSVSLRS